jgi:uncharacterized protein (DUF58 family)
MATVADLSQVDATRVDGAFESPVRLEPSPLMPLRGWAILIAVMVVVGLPLQMRPLLAVAAFLTVMVVAAGLWNHFALYGVSYERTFSERRAFLGEQVQVTVRLINQKRLPVSWLLTFDLWPREIPLVAGGELFGTPRETQSYLVNAFSVRGNQRINRQYTLHCNRRGVYVFGPVRVRTGDLFGLFRQQGGHNREDELIVYPRILPVEALGLPPRNLFGEIRARRRMFEDPSRVIGVRDHLAGDGFRNVHWKATARNQRLQSKVYEPTVSHNVVILLNVATGEEYWRGADEATLEWAVTVAASVAHYAAGQRFGVGLMANGSMYRSDQAIKVPPGRSLQQLTHILEALATVTGYATSAIESLLMAESPRLPWGATLVIVTAAISEELLATLIRLREVGRRLVLLALTQQPPVILPGVLTYHLPSQEPLSRFIRPGGESDEGLGSLVFESLV